MAEKRSSLAEAAAKARAGQRVNQRTGVASATSVDTLAGDAAQAGTTADREKMGDPAKKEAPKTPSVLATIAARAKKKTETKGEK